MKRHLLMLAVPVLAMGCANDEKPAAPKPVAVAPAPAVVAPAVAKPTAPAPKGYFETKKDGTTYVFGSFASMQSFRNGGAELKWTKKEGPNGEAVALESDGGQLSDSLWGEYAKSHPKKVGP